MSASAPRPDPVMARLIADASHVWGRHYPGVPLCAVMLVGMLAGGEPVRLPVPVPSSWDYVAPARRSEDDPADEPAVSGPAAGPPRAFNSTERKILDALAARPDGGPPFSGPELARQAGYSFNGRFRETLARLVREGHVVNGGRGYSLP